MEGLVISSWFWKDKRVLITGHTGFKGAWLCLWLQSRGARVIGYALSPPTEPSLFEIAHVADGMTSLTGDVRDLDQLTRAVKEHHPEVIFHMAAQSLVRESYRDPVTTYATNVMGMVNILEATRQTGAVRVVLGVTSDKCYENQEWVWGYRENDSMGGYDPYSNSKGCAELVASAYRNSYFNPAAFSKHNTAVATARAGNVIGGGDWANDRLIPDIIRALISGNPAIIRNPDAIRPWQHVMGPLHGYLLLAEKLWTEGAAYCEAWNFGPEDADAQPVSRIADQLTTMWSNGATWTCSGGDHPHEAHYLKLDISKARLRLGWKPLWGLELALQSIVEWYQAYQAHQDMRSVTLAQINSFSMLESGQ